MLRTLHWLAAVACVGVAAASRTYLRIASDTERQPSDFTVDLLQTSSSCAEALSRSGLFSSESGGLGLTDGAFLRVRRRRLRALYTPRVVQFENGCAKTQCPYDCDTFTCMCASCVGTSGCGKAGQCLNPNNFCVACNTCPVGQCASVVMNGSHPRAIVCGACPASWTTQGAQTNTNNASEPAQAPQATGAQTTTNASQPASPAAQTAPVSHVTAESLGGVSLDKCAFYDYSKRGSDDAYGWCDEKTAANLFCTRFGFGSAVSWTTAHEKAGYIIGCNDTNPDTKGMGADVLPTVTCTK